MQSLLRPTEENAWPMDLNYKDILDALPVGVAFAVPFSKHRSASSSTRQPKDFRFVYINGVMEREQQPTAADEDGRLVLQPGQLLSQLARRQRSSSIASSGAIGRTEDGPAKEEGQTDKTKKPKKLKRTEASATARRLLKAHRHAWNSGEEVEVRPKKSSSSSLRNVYLVKPLKRAEGETVGIITMVQKDVVACAPQEAATDSQCDMKPTSANTTTSTTSSTTKWLEARRDRFIADMSHEIRTPMNGLIGMVSLLVDDEDLSTLQREVVDTMYASAQHLLMLINDMLDYSKLALSDDGDIKLKITSTPINICQVVHDCVSAYTTQARDYGVDIVIRVAPGIIKHPFFYSDPLRLRQVLANLVSNSVKFTKEGFVLVDVDYGRSRRQSTDTHEDGDHNTREICFRVIDTGLGVQREQMESIFLPYVQEESRETENCGGTGLGLSIARQIAVCMGGSLELECSHRRGRRRSIDPTSAIQKGFSALVSKFSHSSSSSDSSLSQKYSSNHQRHALCSNPSSLYEPFTRTSGSTFTLRLPMKADLPPSGTSHAHGSPRDLSPAPSLPSLRLSGSIMTSPPVPLKILLVGLPPIMTATVSELLTSFDAKCESISMEEAFKVFTTPSRSGLKGIKASKARPWDLVMVFKDQGDEYSKLAKQIRKEEKIMLLLMAYSTDHVDTRKLEEDGWDAYSALPVQPIVLVQMIARLRDKINKRAEKQMARRLKPSIIAGNVDSDLERAKRNWHLKNKKVPSPEAPKRDHPHRFLRRGKSSYSDERVPHEQEIESQKRTLSAKPKLITRYSVISTKPKVDDSGLWGNLQALVVDDNAINRKVAIRMLESLGFQRKKIVHAYNGEEALSKVQGKKFDIILMDCFMPRLNGWECSRRLRADGFDGIIIATTGAVSSVEVARCQQSGMDACLQKPLVLDVFRETLHAAWRTHFEKSSASATTSSAEGIPPGVPTSASAPSIIITSITKDKERNTSL